MDWDKMKRWWGWKFKRKVDKIPPYKREHEYERAKTAMKKLLPWIPIIGILYINKYTPEETGTDVDWVFFVTMFLQVGWVSGLIPLYIVLISWLCNH